MIQSGTQQVLGYPQRPSHPRSHSSISSAVGNSEGGQRVENLRPVISPVRPPRQSPPPPQQIPIDHSSTFILRSKRPASQEEEELLLEAAKDSEEKPFTGNALEWYLKRVDKSLDGDKVKPSAAASAYYRASQTQSGQSAIKGIGSVAGTAVNLGGRAVKAAAPLGKWALLKGLGVAGQLLSPSSKGQQGKQNDSNKQD